ncbi:type VI secretion system contractile sheath small subunit [Sulfitobacter sp. M57]|uniref:type VI secretion system contractile sheath small subunit n=1 Tax=unclassified Sulfitobacter TaxID=196795 RepID=UPI0023E1C7EB|nr:MULTISPECIES: type VI secretion system contractile sheath small subunit [unclassified Sulfitobacter]MDF3416131.1 type VI secretion system contractile sheath small subunit [Sulfitobacter sp. KE5]MDF3423610.1 type VI secretion system contractile sheath small subunit [Sulfitobacter sp. KE43]MDF3434588.1 type VI secretion system contractile sheath small subunit [Sulfitobacter sp. KE42]MDF3460316.1 type VI secretion system contractile sheath small subunit [Sulfitobacter sp. S74]MDF3464126.1 type
MASDSGSGFIKRNRPPRVQIQYEDPYDSEKMVELPFVMGVMSDLSGNNPGVEPEAADDRKFSDVTKDTLDDYMGATKPGMTFMVGNKLDPDSGQKMGVDLQFEKMEDLEPAAIARQVPALRKILEAREQLANLQRYMSAKPKAQEHLQKLLSDPELMAALADRAGPDTDDD